MDDPIHVLITLPFTDEMVAALQEVSPRLALHVVVARRVEEVEAESWKQAEVLYTNRLLPTPEQAPRLKWIQFHWAGIDHAINAPIMDKPGLVATTLSGAAASQVAEFIVTMLLASGHHLPELLNLKQRSEWPARPLGALQPQGAARQHGGDRGLRQHRAPGSAPAAGIWSGGAGDQARRDAPRGPGLHRGGDGRPAGRPGTTAVPAAGAARHAQGVRFRGGDRAAHLRHAA